MTLPSTDINLNTTKKKLIALGVLALVFLVGFAVGKFNNKPNISIEEHQQTTTTSASTAQSQTQTQAQVATASNVNQDLVKDTDTTTVTTTDKKPTGEVVTTTTTEAKTHVDNTTQAKQTTQADV